MDVALLFCLSLTLVFCYAGSTDDFHISCPELWRLRRDKDATSLVSFTNKTWPGKYSFYMWHWKANSTFQWETSLWTSFQTEKLLGNAVLRSSDNSVSHSVVWRLHNGTLLWSYYGDQLNQSNWTISVCKILDWSFFSGADGKWKFHLGDIQLHQPNGKRTIIIQPAESQVSQDNNSPKPEIPGSEDNNQPIYSTRNIRYSRSSPSNNESEKYIHHSNSTPAEKWRIVEAVLDRVFGNSEDIRQNGWVSHFNIFRVLGRLFGIGTSSSRVTTESSILEDVETFNPNTLQKFPGNRVILKKSK